MTLSLPRVRPLVNFSLAALVLTLLTWANWQSPTPTPAAPPIQRAVLRIGGLTDPARAAELARRLAVRDGITACSLNAVTQIADVTHDPDYISAAELRRALADGGAYVVMPVPSDVSAVASFGPPSPGSASYGAALKRLRGALNFRRFFVKD